MPPAKKFKPDLNLPERDDYREPAPKEFWTKYPENTKTSTKSLIDAHTLRRLAMETNYPHLKHLEKIVHGIEHGFKTGCSGKYRYPSVAKNTPSAYVDGVKVTDAIGSWIKKDFVRGPVTREKLPQNAKVSAIMTRSKPNGKVRVILNLSGPKGSSVNEGIDPQEFPATMSSTTEWVKVLTRAGRGCLITKVDWADAYKHLAVHPTDLDLQWFEWLGRYFCELCLVFGSASSAGLFDSVAKILLWIVSEKSGLDMSHIIQHLDDVCAAAPAESGMCQKFDDTFIQVASEVGVKLAPRDDPQKSFGPSTSGTVLGVNYDTVTWTWGIPKDKLVRLLHTLTEFIESNSVLQKEMWSLVGKIQHVRPLVPGGKFNIDHLIRANSESEYGLDSVSIHDGLREQLRYWRIILQLVTDSILIPNPWAILPPWTLDVYTDAAGGSLHDPLRGVGAVCPGWFAFIPWGHKINAGYKDGLRRLDKKMSAWELLGPLLVITAGHNFCRNSPIRVHVDNQGAVYIFEKGYSSKCRLTTTIAKAIAVIMAGINCRMEVVKIVRCFNTLASMSDDLSKCNFTAFCLRAAMDGIALPEKGSKVPASLLEWVKNPREDDNLGYKILADLARVSKILGYNC